VDTLGISNMEPNHLHIFLLFTHTIIVKKGHACAHDFTHSPVRVFSLLLSYLAQLPGFHQSECPNAHFNCGPSNYLRVAIVVGR
jgi:hypothetical protein